MLSRKFAVLSIFGMIYLIAIVILSYIIFFKKKSSKNAKDGDVESISNKAIANPNESLNTPIVPDVGDFEHVFNKATVNLKEPIQHWTDVPGDFISLFIAVVFIASRLSNDDL